MSDKPRIAHFSGSNATIQNSPPLVTNTQKLRDFYATQTTLSNLNRVTLKTYAKTEVGISERGATRNL